MDAVSMNCRREMWEVPGSSGLSVAMGYSPNCARGREEVWCRQMRNIYVGASSR
jgi:hypothetical protein